jgi:hypothetical protein
MERTLPELRIDIAAGPAADDHELALLTADLRDELLELDVYAISSAAGALPPVGAKGLDAGTAGTLLVNLTDSAVVVALIGLLRSWVTRSQGRRVRVKVGKDVLDVTAVSAEDQTKIITSWLDAHAR